MSKRHRKSKDFTTHDELPMEIDPFSDPSIMQAPKGKRPKGKAWGKHKRQNRKTGYYD